MKKIIALLLSALFILALAGCGSSGGGSTNVIEMKDDAEYMYKAEDLTEIEDLNILDDVTNEEKWKIGFCTTAMDEMNIIMYDGMKEAAEKLGVEVVVTSADNLVDKQISDVESLIEQKCDVILLKALDRDALVQACGQVQDAGIKLIIMGMPVNTDRFDLLVMADQAQVASKQAAYLNSVLEANPDLNLKIGYMWGNTGFSGIELRYRGFVDNMDWDSGRAEIIDEQIANFNQNEAISVTENWIQKFGDDINCIVAQSDAMALGAVEAVKAAGRSLDDFYILGVDGTAAALESIQKGEMKMTAYNDLYQNGVFSIQQAIDLLNNPEKYAETKTFSIGDMFIVLTKDNVDEYINQ